jgi:integrase/recombinase XerD
MTGLRQAAADYLALRRALGFKLGDYPWLLSGLVSYLEAAGAATVTTELATAWVLLPAGARPAYLAKRLSVARGFARHLHAFDPAAEVPPAGLLNTAPGRPGPYLYSAQDITALMAAAGQLRPALRAVTYQTLVGLLAVTGMRIGEAIGLDRGDIDFDDGVLTVWYSKFGKSRELPLHPTTVNALKAYASARDRLCPTPTAPSFLVSAAGTRLVYVTVQQVFSGLIRAAGIKPEPGGRGPRLHDTRHTFACLTMTGWYRAGADVQARMPLLSTYLGHSNPSNTYWYLSAVPELLSLAAHRREQAQAARRQS